MPLLRARSTAVPFFLGRGPWGSGPGEDLAQCALLRGSRARLSGRTGELVEAHVEITRLLLHVG